MDLKAGQVLKYKIHADLDDHYLVRDQRNREFKLLKSYCKKRYVKNQFVQLYAVQEKDGKLFLTPNLPILSEGDIGSLTVVEQNKFGVFLDNGTDRDLMLPNSEKIGYISDGDQLIIKVIRGENDLLKATMQFNTYSQVKEGELKKGQSVKARVVEKLEKRDTNKLKGIRAVLPSGLLIFIHVTEMERIPRLNDLIEPRIIFIREDNKVNATLLPHVKARPKINMDIILKRLHEDHGVSPVTDKSDVELIQKTFGLSKKAFKKAISTLLSEDKIELKDNKLYLKEKGA